LSLTKICWLDAIAYPVNGGHNPLPATAPKITQTDRACYCGQLNCIETYLCGAGFSQSYAELTSENITGEHIAQLLGSGDGKAIKVFNLYCRQLAASLATLINVLDPDVIVLGGGLSNFKYLATEVEKVLPDYVFSEEVMTRVVKNLHGDSSGVRGAAWL